MKLLRALLVAASLSALLYPIGARQLARRRAIARVTALEQAPGSCRVTDDATLSLRLQRLGPLLASWETIGGCGAGGGTNGAGVLWVGRNTTGGLFQLITLSNFITIPKTGPTGPGLGGYNLIVNNQIMRDFTDKWSAGVSIPYAYKYYREPFSGVGPVTNAGLADVNVLGKRKIGTDNSTTLWGIVTLPTGTYNAAFMGSALNPDEQLGFGRFTGSVLVDHTFDQDWGPIIVGSALNYRGGKNSAHNYRAPGATLYGNAGYFAGPLVPAVGLNLTGYTQQDTRGDFGETLNAPVLTAAVQASIEWSNPYLAVLLGAYVPWALLDQDWHTSGHFQLQAWTLALGISVSPF